MSINFEELKSEMPFKWKVQTASEYNCMCVAYVDSRQVQDKLDDVLGAMNWQDEYFVIDGDLFCRIGIYDEEKREWVWKGDCGTESMTEKEKGQASDAFKRAAVKWGVGRFLYSMDIQKIKSGKDNRGKNVPVDETGKQIWDITKHINDKLSKASPKVEIKAVEIKPVVVETKTDNRNFERYSTTKSTTVQYSKTAVLNNDTMTRVRTLSRDGLTGGDVIKTYLDKYNAFAGTTYVASDMKTDAIVNAVIDFIDNSSPVNL